MRVHGYIDANDFKRIQDWVKDKNLTNRLMLSIFFTHDGFPSKMAISFPIEAVTQIHCLKLGMTVTLNKKAL